MTRGKFITLEGTEGVGKTTNLQFIHELLLTTGKDCVVTREPGGTEIGESLRQLLLDHSSTGISDEAELLLMFAARAEHLNKVIRPAIENGNNVLCDRFTEATYAYQGGGRGINESKIAQLEQWVQADFRPDLTIILDCPVEIGRERAGKRSKPDRIEREKDDFFNRVRSAYQMLATQHPDRICLIDASLDLVSVQASIKSCLQKYNVI